MKQTVFSTHLGKRPYKNEDFQRLQDTIQEVLQILPAVLRPNQHNVNVSFVLKEPSVTYTNPNPATTTYTWQDGWIYLKGKIIFVKAGSYTYTAGAVPLGWYWDRVVVTDPAGTRIYANTQTHETYIDDYLQLRPYFIAGAQDDYSQIISITDFLAAPTNAIMTILNEEWSVMTQNDLVVSGITLSTNSNFGMRYKKVGSSLHINMTLAVGAYNGSVLTVDLPPGITLITNGYGISWQYTAHWQDAALELTPFYVREIPNGVGGNNRFEIRPPSVGPFSNLPYTNPGNLILNATIEIVA